MIVFSWGFGFYPSSDVREEFKLYFSCFVRSICETTCSSSDHMDPSTRMYWFHHTNHKLKYLQMDRYYYKAACPTGSICAKWQKPESWNLSKILCSLTFWEHRRKISILWKPDVICWFSLLSFSVSNLRQILDYSEEFCL